MTFDNTAGERNGAQNRPSGQTARSRETAEPWHTLAVADVARRLGTDVTRGLSATEVSRRYAEHGPNALADIKGRSSLSIFVAQFRSLIVLLLVAAGGVALRLGRTYRGGRDPGRHRPERRHRLPDGMEGGAGADGPPKQAVPVAQVIRDGAEDEIPAAELVPGTWSSSPPGHGCPPTAGSSRASRLQIEEAALTGESLAVAKTPTRCQDTVAPLGDRAQHGLHGHDDHRRPRPAASSRPPARRPRWARSAP